MTSDGAPREQYTSSYGAGDGGPEAVPMLAAGTGPHNTYISVEYMLHLWLLRGANRTLLAPLDRVKYIMQCQKELVRMGRLRGSFRNSWACAQHLRRLEGSRSFWRGNLVQVISLLPIALAQIFIALPTESFIFNSCPAHSAIAYTIIGYCAVVGAALAASVVTYPLEYARFRMAVDIKPYRGASYEFRHSLAFVSHRAMLESPHYLYKGLGLYIVGSYVYHAVHHCMLRLVTPWVPAETAHSRWWTIAVQSACGLAISGVATMGLHPVDLVRHRMMIAVTEERYRYPSAMHCVAHIAQHEGLAGLYRGAMITLTRMMMATGLVIVGLGY